jgi:hypothetical protein
MQPFRYEGAYILSQPKHIVVEDFIALRKTSKGRRFNPYLHLRIDEFDVVLDGYDAIWEFLDVIQPNMYRTQIQAGMLGKLDLPHTFDKEIQALIDESQVEWICFNYDKKKFVIPNTRPKRKIEAHIASTVHDCTMVEEGWRWKPEGCIAKMLLPFNNKDLRTRCPSYIYGEHPQLCIVQEIKVKTWRVSTIIHANCGADYRIAPQKCYWNPEMDGFKDMNNYITRMSFHMAEIAYDISNTLSNKDRVGMYSRERDRLEYDRYIFQIGGKN